MMFRILLACGLGGLLCLPLAAQQPNKERYQPLVAQGPLPADFQASVAGLPPDGFAPGQASYIRELFMSGNVIFGDTVSRYLHTLVQRLLPQPPAGCPPLRVYVVRSPEVNAFSASGGIIFVNLGLVARMRTEAQLAFVIGHEISHILQRHDLSIARETEAAQRASMFGAANTQAVLRARMRCTREKEHEADLHGAALYLAAGYPVAEMFAALAVLGTAYLPDAVHPLSPDFFRAGNEPFPASYYLDPQATAQLASPTVLPGDSSHPDPEIRINALRNALEQLKATQGRTAPPDEEADFGFIRELSRFEVCRLYAQFQHYEAALALAYELLQSHPNNYYLQFTIDYCLYAFAVYTASGKFWDIHTGYEYLSGTSRQVAFWLEKMRGDELVQLAFNRVAALYSIHREDSALAAMQEDLYCVLCRQMDQQNCLCDALVRPLKARYRFALGVEKAVFVEPFYLRLNAGNVTATTAAADQQQLVLLLDQYARKVGLTPRIVAASVLDSTHASDYNDWSVLLRYQAEQDRNTLHLTSLYHSETSRLSQQFGCQTFVWMGYTAEYQPSRKRTYWMMCLPLFPFSLAYAFAPRHVTRLYTAVYDLKKDQPLLIYPRVIRLHDTPDVVRATLYDVLHQLHNPVK